MSLIRLQFVLGASWSSRLIAWYGSGYGGFSHVDAILADGTLIGARSDVVGGQPPGLRQRPANYERWKKCTVVTFPDTEAAYDKWESGLKSMIGYGYDKADILGFILGIPLAQPGHWICSAAQTYELEKAGILPALPFLPQQITPTSLFLMSVAAGGKHEVQW